VDSYTYHCERGFLYQLAIDRIANLDLGVPVYDIVLETSQSESSSIFKALHFFKTIIEERLYEKSILCFVTSEKPITKSKKNSSLSNPQYRFELFDKVFKRTASTYPEIIKEDFVFSDTDRYVTFLYHSSIKSDAKLLVKTFGLLDEKDS